MDCHGLLVEGTAISLCSKKGPCVWNLAFAEVRVLLHFLLLRTRGAVGGPYRYFAAQVDFGKASGPFEIPTPLFHDAAKFLGGHAAFAGCCCVRHISGQDPVVDLFETLIGIREYTIEVLYKANSRILPTKNPKNQ